MRGIHDQTGVAQVGFFHRPYQKAKSRLAILPCPPTVAALICGMRRTPIHLRLLCLLLAVQVLCLQAGAGLAFFYCPQCVALRFTAECPQMAQHSCCAKIKSCCAKKPAIKAENPNCCVKIQLPDTEGAKLLSSLPATEKLHLLALPEAAFATPIFALNAKRKEDGGPDPPPRPRSLSGRDLLLRSSTLLI